MPHTRLSDTVAADAGTRSGGQPARGAVAIDEVIRLCADASAAQGVNSLVEAVGGLIPGARFEHILTRGHWHRLGGVVDADYRPVAPNIAQWAEETSGGDVDELLARYADAGWYATHIAGKTHYLTATTGPAPEDFVQLEVEELCEVVARPLVIDDWFPDSIEEFLEPLDFPHIDNAPVGEPYFRFRRQVSCADLLSGSQLHASQARNLRRFFDEWRDSSAGEHAIFARHWVMALREYTDSEGDQRLTARPVGVGRSADAELPDDTRLRGAALANAIHGFDRESGYPFAWYFAMLSERADHHRLAAAVLADLMGAYDYLPERDLRVLRAWEERPYAV